MYFRLPLNSLWAQSKQCFKRARDVAQGHSGAQQAWVQSPVPQKRKAEEKHWINFPEGFWFLWRRSHSLSLWHRWSCTRGPGARERKERWVGVHPTCPAPQPLALGSEPLCHGALQSLALVCGTSLITSDNCIRWIEWIQGMPLRTGWPGASPDAHTNGPVMLLQWGCSVSWLLNEELYAVCTLQYSEQRSGQRKLQFNDFAFICIVLICSTIMHSKR